MGEEKAEIPLYSSSDTDGTASLHQRKDSYFAAGDYQVMKVPVIALDDFVAEHGIDFVDFIKMDIEGHELCALKGMSKMLSISGIGAFSFEFGSGNLNSRTQFRDFWDLLSGKYDLYRITPAGKLIRLSAYYEDMEFYRGATNFLAILKEGKVGPVIKSTTVCE